MGRNFLGLDGLKHFWSKAKTWIAEQITAEVTAKIAQIIAEAPESLNTLKEIADWISTHEDSASAMNSAILANTEAISGKADKSHTHTKSQITDFPTSLPANGGTADKATSDANGNNIVDTYATKTELVKAVPSYGAADAGKALTVSSGGTGTEWHRLIKYHDIACGNVTIPSSGYVEFNSYLEGNDVPISAVIYRWATNTGAFYVTAYAGNPKLFYVVGTPGVVVMELTVRIFCVDKFALEG